ncbi:hypothetical protein NL389_33235, partial [Klebsiella pneumoniae]|nr:hypothetical protein [Klebsiella pneumoniae]
FKKTVLCAVTALFTTPLFANIPIESRGLSQATNQTAVNTPAAIAAGATPAVQTNTSWQIMQKNQQLENDLRILRGKHEMESLILTTALLACGSYLVALLAHASAPIV